MKLRDFFYFIVIVLFPFFAAAQSADTLYDTVPLNSAVRQGVMPNGMKYFILRNKEPKNTISMCLTVNAGKFNEDPDQLGLAHVVEHLAFESTTNFPMGVRTFFLSRGVDYGSGFHASTADKATNYFLTIPSRNPDLLNSGMTLLRDWGDCNSFSFLPDEVERARAAVLRELSLSNTASWLSFLDSRYKMLDENPLYEPKLNATIRNVRECALDCIIRFYKDWYHPKFETVIIVGDLNEDEIEQQILEKFAPLTNEGARNRPDNDTRFDVPLTGKNRLIIVEDMQVGEGVAIEIYKKEKDAGAIVRTEYDIKVHLMDRVFNEMIHPRLNVRRKQGDTDFARTIQVFIRGAINPHADIAALLTKIKVKNVVEIKSAVRFAATEIERVRRYGFDEIEFRAAKDRLLASFNKSGDNSSSYLMTRLMGYGENGSAYPANEESLKKELLSSITLKEMNEMYAPLLTMEGDIDIVMTANARNLKFIPKEKELFSLMRAQRKTRISRYKPPIVKPIPLPDVNVAPPSPIIRVLPNNNITELMFSSGLTVVLKELSKDPSDPMPERVILHGFNRNLTNEIANRWKLNHLKSITLFTGVGVLSRGELLAWEQERNRTGQYLGVSPYFDDTGVGISGASSPENAEEMLKLVYAYFTSAFPDRKAFKKYCESYNDSAKKSGVELFYDTIDSYQNSSLFENELTKEEPNRPSDLNEIFRIYKRSFSNSSNFTFVVTGSFDRDQMIKIVTRYLGALPDSKEADEVKSVSNKFASRNRTMSRNIDVTLVKDSTGNVNVKMLFVGECENNLRNRLTLEVLRNTINTLLYNRLREKEKGVYYALTSINIKTNDRIFLGVEFESAPEDITRLTDAVKEELDRLGKGQLADDVFFNAIAVTKQRISRDLRSPQYWNDYLVGQMRLGKHSLDERNYIEETVDRLTLSDVTNAVRTYINTRNYIVFKLL